MAVHHNNLLGKVIYIGTSSSCKDSEVAVMLWNGWIGCGDKALITWLPGEWSGVNSWSKFWFKQHNKTNMQQLDYANSLYL